MARFALTTMIPSRSGYVWWPVEIDADTVDEIRARLKAEGVIQAVKLETYRMPGGEMVVRGRTPVLVGAAMIGTLTPMHLEIVEEPAAA